MACVCVCAKRTMHETREEEEQKNCTQTEYPCRVLSVFLVKYDVLHLFREMDFGVRMRRTRLSVRSRRCMLKTWRRSRWRRERFEGRWTVDVCCYSFFVGVGPLLAFASYELMLMPDGNDIKMTNAACMHALCAFLWSFHLDGWFWRKDIMHWHAKDETKAQSENWPSEVWSSICGTLLVSC